MQVLLMIKINQREDLAKYELELQLVRPNGETTKENWKQTATISRQKQWPDFPSGINVNAHITVVPSQMGIHYWSALLDGKEIARVPFTLLEQEPEKLAVQK